MINEIYNSIKNPKLIKETEKYAIISFDVECFGKVNTLKFKLNRIGDSEYFYLETSDGIYYEDNSEEKIRIFSFYLCYINLGLLENINPNIVIAIQTGSFDDFVYHIHFDFDNDKVYYKYLDIETLVLPFIIEKRYRENLRICLYGKKFNLINNYHNDVGIDGYFLQLGGDISLDISDERFIEYIKVVLNDSCDFTLGGETYFSGHLEILFDYDVKFYLIFGYRLVDKKVYEIREVNRVRIGD